MVRRTIPPKPKIKITLTKKGEPWPTDRYAILSKNKEEFLDKVQQLASAGLSYREIGIAFQVSRETIKYWMKNMPDFREAYKEAEQEAIEGMRKSMYEQGTGYYYNDVVVLTNRVTERNGDGTSITYTKPLIVKVEKFQHPNAWATNRWLEVHDKQWQQQKNVLPGTQINIQNNYDLSKYTPEELQVLEKLGMKKLLAGMTSEENIEG